MKVYVVYSCYSESYSDPSIFFEVCGTKAKAKEIFNGFIENINKQAADIYCDMGYEEGFDSIFSTEESDNTFECRELDGDKAWEAYIVEQEILV